LGDRRYRGYFLFTGTASSVVLMPNYYARVTFTLHLRRRPLYYVMNVFIACCLLSFVAVVTFILPPSCDDRLGLSTYNMYTVSVFQENCANLFFCQNFAKFRRIVKIFGTKIAERTRFSEVYSVSTSPNLCQHTKTQMFKIVT